MLSISRHDTEEAKIDRAVENVVKILNAGVEPIYVKDEVQVWAMDKPHKVLVPESVKRASSVGIPGETLKDQNLTGLLDFARSLC